MPPTPPLATMAPGTESDTVVLAGSG